MSRPLAEVLTEVVLFCMDSVVAHHSGEALLYRLHDNFWIWGPHRACLKAWAAATKFTQLMGLEINEEKSGSAVTSHKNLANSTIAPRKRHTCPDHTIQGPLPRGDIAWGLLVLDPMTGQFKVDKKIVS